MSRRANVVRHAANHMCGGSDPIPGICDLVGLLPVTYPDQILAHITIGDLVAYWRMGESTYPLLDYAQNPAGDLPLAHTPTGTPAATLHVTGGLPVADDDGAAELTYNQGTSDAAAGGHLIEYFFVSDTTGSPPRWTFANTAPFTVECLAKPTATWTVTLHGVVGNLSGAGWAIQGKKTTGGFYASFVRAASTSSETVCENVAVVCPYGEWTHLAATYDGTTMRLYVNGVQVAVAASALNLPSIQAIKVGRTTVGALGAECLFYGAVDEVAVYNAVVTPGEILEHATAASLTSSSTSAGLLTVYVNGV